MTTEKYLGPQIKKSENTNNVTLLAYPEFAKELNDRFGVRNGLLLSLLIGQLAFWINKSTTDRLGNFYWTYQSFRGMQHKAFHFVSYPTLHRAVRRLSDTGILITNDRFNKRSYDRTLWYTFRPEKLAEFTSVVWRHPPEMFPNRPELQHLTDKKIRVLPELAREIGLNESIVLLQIAYLIQIQNEIRDGHYVATQSVQHFKSWFPHMSQSSLNSKVAKLKEHNLIVKYLIFDYETQRQTQVFSLNADGLKQLESIRLDYESKYPNPYKFSKFHSQNK